MDSTLVFDEKSFEEGKIPPKPTGEIPRWITEEYPERIRDMANDLFSAVYWKVREKAEVKMRDKNIKTPEKDIHLQTMLMMKALNNSAAQANNINELSERVFLILANRINETGSYRVDKEYDSLEEWAINEIMEFDESQAGKTKLSHFQFLIHEFLPMIRHLGKDTGYKPENLLMVKDHKSKAFAAIPYLRSHTKEYRDTEIRFAESLKDVSRKIQKWKQKVNMASKEEKPKVLEELQLLEETRKQLQEDQEAEQEEQTNKMKNAINKTLEVIQDPNVSAWGANGVGKILKSQGKPKIFEGDKCVLKDNRVVFSLVVEPAYERAVITRLKEFVEFTDTDGERIVASIGSLILKDGKEGKKANANLRRSNRKNSKP